MVVEGFMLGLGTGSYCSLTCSPMILPLLFSRRYRLGESTGVVLRFLLGRLIAYVVVGALLGALGVFALGFVDPLVQKLLGALAYGLAGGFMLIQGLALAGHGSWLCRAARKTRAPTQALVFGLVSGFSLCPPFLAAAARVFGQHSGIENIPASVLGGSLYFLCFFLGTSVFFLPLLGVGLIRKLPFTLAMVARVVMVVLGAWFLVFLGVLPALGVL